MQLFVKYKDDCNVTNDDSHQHHWTGHKNAIQVILLQHVKEQSRPTSTSPLLIDANNSNDKLSKYLNVSKWTWSGRSDNKKIEEQLKEQLKEQRGAAILLWTGGGKASFPSISQDNSKTQPVYIVLDGTWQEAQTMFRKLPALQRLQRCTLASSSASAFFLRKDYSGWRSKYRHGNDDDDIHPLCTAEVVATLLETAGGANGGGGRIIRRRLDAFQRNFGKQRRRE